MISWVWLTLGGCAISRPVRMTVRGPSRSDLQAALRHIKAVLPRREDDHCQYLSDVHTSMQSNSQPHVVAPTMATWRLPLLRFVP